MFMLTFPVSLVFIVTHFEHYKGRTALLTQC